MPSNPFLKSITLTTLNTNYSLLTLLQALDPGVNGRCCKLNLQLDPGAGAAKLFIGNDDLSGTMYGAALLAGQVKVWETAQINLINASQIFLRSDTSAVKVNVDLLVQ
jgi:hypothetical protein